MNEPPAVELDDLEEALSFVSAADMLEHDAWICRDTGEVLSHCEEIDEFDPPDDIDNLDRYEPIPDKHDLGLGKPLALEFARMQLPDCFDEVRRIFSRRGAYARFKDLLAKQNHLEAWYQWEAEQTRQALRDWCMDNDIPLAD